MKLRLCVAGIALAIMTSLAGCGSEASIAGSTGGTEAASTSGKTDLIMGTGGTSGTYYIVGVAMGQAVTEHSDLANVIVQSSVGSMENLNLTATNQMQLGFSNEDGIYFAHYGTGVYEDMGEQDILGVMSLYMSAGQMVTKADSGIKTYADLKGKKVCLGPPSTTIIEMSKAILREYGIDPETDISPYYLSFEEGVTKVVDGELDATFFVAGTPTATLMNAASINDMELVDADPEIPEKVAEENPYYIPYVIPADTYNGIDHDTNTLKIMTTIFTNSQVSEDVIYDFCKNAFDYLDTYRNAHTVLEEVSLETAADMTIPLHPGAERYFREQGVIE